MLVASHVAKFRRMDAALARLDPRADREIWIWTAMCAATNLYNAALHRSGVTVESRSFHSQLDGLYVVPDPATGALRDALDPPGDVMHVGQPRLDAKLSPQLERAGMALQGLEALREPYVRGYEEPVPGAEAAWQAMYAECTAALQIELGAAHGR